MCAIVPVKAMPSTAPSANTLMIPPRSRSDDTDTVVTEDGGALRFSDSVREGTDTSEEATVCIQPESIAADRILFVKLVGGEAVEGRMEWKMSL